MRLRVVGSLLGLGLVVACAPTSTLSHVGQTPAPVDSTRSSRTANTLYLINGRELARGHSVRELAPAHIVSVEHFIGPAALRYGVGSDSDVVVITTNDSLTAMRLTVPTGVQGATGSAQSDSSFIILINSMVMLPGHHVRELDARSFTSVDVYKGPAAQLFGSTHGRSVVAVNTRDSVAAARLTRP